MQGIYTADDVVKILKESFSHVSEQWAQSHEDHSAATVATITKVQPETSSTFHAPSFVFCHRDARAFAVLSP